MKTEQNKIETVFADLKSKEILPRNRKLRQTILAPNFRSAILFSNTIDYNPKFRDMEEDNIRFCLLHEEGHKIKNQYGTPSLFFMSILSLIPFLLILIFYLNKWVLVLSSFFYSMVLIIVALSTLREAIWDDEFDSDIFAAEILRDYYGIKKPSYVAYNTFAELQSIFHPTYPKKVSIFEKIEASLFNIHPPMDERVRKIAHLVDCY